MVPIHLPKLKSESSVTPGTMKLQPLEPQTLSPGPKENQLPLDIGSPPPRYRPLNPFGYTDPLLHHFGYPPRWIRLGLIGRNECAWNPEEQLRRDQEAAMMLSELRSRI
jgi:hypothetical protein